MGKEAFFFRKWPHSVKKGLDRMKKDLDWVKRACTGQKRVWAG